MVPRPYTKGPITFLISRVRGTQPHYIGVYIYTSNGRNAGVPCIALQALQCYARPSIFDAMVLQQKNFQCRSALALLIFSFFFKKKRKKKEQATEVLASLIMRSKQGCPHKGPGTHTYVYVCVLGLLQSLTQHL